MALERRPKLKDILAVWGEPLAITVTMTEGDPPEAATGITGCTATITSTDGATVKATATGTEQSTGVYGVTFTDSQLTTDVGPGRWMYAVTITIDGSEQTVLAGSLRLNRPAISGIAQ